jgi:hypothetical protein
MGQVSCRERIVVVGRVSGIRLCFVDFRGGGGIASMWK